MSIPAILRAVEMNCCKICTASNLASLFTLAAEEGSQGPVHSEHTLYHWPGLPSSLVIFFLCAVQQYINVAMKQLTFHIAKLPRRPALHFPLEHRRGAGRGGEKIDQGLVTSCLFSGHYQLLLPLWGESSEPTEAALKISSFLLCAPWCP